MRATVFGSVVAALAMVQPCAAQQTVTAPGGVAVGGNIVGSTLNFGLTPEQLREVTKAAVEGATEPLIGRIEDIGKRLGVTEDAANTLLRIVGEQPDVPDERLGAVLTKVATQYNRLQATAGGATVGGEV
jgi:hypothetical protein